MSKQWFVHPESDSHFVDDETYEGDGLCQAIGEALNDSEEDFQRALKEFNDNEAKFRK